MKWILPKTREKSPRASTRAQATKTHNKNMNTTMRRKERMTKLVIFKCVEDEFHPILNNPFEYISFKYEDHYF